MTDELAGPNGIAFSPDERFLYVGNWDPDHKVVMRYEVDDAGELVERQRPPRHDRRARARTRSTASRSTATATSTSAARAASGCSRPTATHLGTLELPESPHNLAWGDEDGRTLYITAETSVYRMRLAIPGIRPE